MSFTKLLIFAAAISTTPHTTPDPPERPPAQECGQATVYGYGTRWHGDTTASGEPFRPRKEATCAHRTLPLGTTIYVDTPAGGGWCRVNDRGPYMVRQRPGSSRRFFGTALRNGWQWAGVIDLSIKAAKRMQMDGKQRVCLHYHAPAGASTRASWPPDR